MKKSLLFAGLCAAMSLTAVAQNPYAYGLKAVGLNEGKVSATATELKVNYTLNAPATTVSVDVYDGESLVK